MYIVLYHGKDELATGSKVLGDIFDCKCKAKRAIKEDKLRSKEDVVNMVYKIVKLF